MRTIFMQDVHPALLSAHLLHLRSLPQGLTKPDDIHNCLVSRSHTGCFVHLQALSPILGRLGIIRGPMCALAVLLIYHAHRRHVC